jgi:hypothetical protein
LGIPVVETPLSKYQTKLKKLAGSKIIHFQVIHTQDRLLALATITGKAVKGMPGANASSFVRSVGDEEETFCDFDTRLGVLHDNTGRKVIRHFSTGNQVVERIWRNFG